MPVGQRKANFFTPAVELGRVDDHVLGLGPLPLSRKELEGLLESVVAHVAGRREPPELQRAPALVVEHDSPCVAPRLSWFLRHLSSSFRVVRRRPHQLRSKIRKREYILVSSLISLGRRPIAMGC